MAKIVYVTRGPSLVCNDCSHAIPLSLTVKVGPRRVLVCPECGEYREWVLHDRALADAVDLLRSERPLRVGDLFDDIASDN